MLAINRHKQEFETLYSQILGEESFQIEFPLLEIDKFDWKRGGCADEYYAYFYRRFSCHILSRLSLEERQTILVVGCGFGFDEKNIKSLFPDADLWSVDISAEMLRLATANGSPSRFSLALAEKLPFPDQSFHRVLSREVIEHVMRPKAMLKEIDRVLWPGGIAVVTTENEESLGPTNAYDSHLRERLAQVFDFPIAHPEYRDQAPSLQEMKRMIEEAGLILSEYFWDGALYKYLIEISPRARTRMARLAHYFSSLENHRALAKFFCDQVKYVLKKEGEAAPLRHPQTVHYACVYCGGRLSEGDEHYTCPDCGHEYPLREGIPNFIPDSVPNVGEGDLPRQIRQRNEWDRPPFGRRLFPRLNSILRGFYSGTYLAMALLAALFAKKNHHSLSGLLAKDDPYQRYLKLS